MADCPSINTNLPQFPSVQVNAGNVPSAESALSDTPNFVLSTGEQPSLILRNPQTPNASLFALGGIPGVWRLNGLKGIVNIVPSGDNTYVALSGNNIVIGLNPSGITTDLSGYITTGQADLRYYPLDSNPSGYITGLDSSVYINTGQTGQFASSESLYQTGSILYALISSSTAGVSSVNSITGNVEVVGTGNVYIFNDGQRIIVSGDTGIYSNFATLAQLYNTGIALINRDLEISGVLQSQIDSISGVTGTYIESVTQQRFQTGINTGVNSIYINYPVAFSTKPTIEVTMETDAIYSYMFTTTNVTNTGFLASFSDQILESGVILHVYSQVN